MNEVIERPHFKAIVKRSKQRRTTAITIRDEGVVVLAPKRLKQSVIEQFIDETISHLHRLPSDTRVYQVNQDASCPAGGGRATELGGISL